MFNLILSQWGDKQTKIINKKINNQHDLIKQINMTWLNDFSWFNEINEYGLVT